MAHRICPTCKQDMGPEATIGPAVGLTPEEHAAWEADGKPEDWQQWQIWRRKKERQAATTVVTIAGAQSATTVKSPATQEQST